jgi:ribosomal protein S25
MSPHTRKVEKRVHDALLHSTDEGMALDIHQIANRIYHNNASVAEFVATRMALRSLELRGVVSRVVQDGRQDIRGWIHAPVFYWSSEDQVQPCFKVR